VFSRLFHIKRFSPPRPRRGGKPHPQTYLCPKCTGTMTMTLESPEKPHFWWLPSEPALGAFFCHDCAYSSWHSLCSCGHPLKRLPSPRNIFRCGARHFYYLFLSDRFTDGPP
jgi:hypothetical protein